MIEAYNVNREVKFLLSSTNSLHKGGHVIHNNILLTTQEVQVYFVAMIL